MALIWGMGGGEGTRAGSPAARAMRRALARAGGAVALVLAVALGLALASFDAADPSFFSATPKPPSNWLGPLGAMVAAPLMQALGLAAWAVVAVVGVWGWRFAAGHGEARIWTRILAVPPAVALVAVFASLHAPWPGWQVSLGLGGMVGDQAGGWLLGLLPGLSRSTLIWVTLGFAGVTLGLVGFALGLSLAETGAILRWLGRSLGAVLGRFWRLARTALRAGLRAATRPRVAEPDLPRSERLEPAEPTGSWRKP
ncbi:MAG: DNA translocase FtsK 4TM domain-containing protein, partial [Thermohalobaculum sp.]|nr:DNA translocase FtsK 4TM domain-containing protein [Thermohalobaculum sp.]